MRIYKHILPALAVTVCAVALLPLASCTGDDTLREETTPDEGAPARLSLTMRTRAMAAGEQGYEEGSQYENYLDVAHGDYKIYFFDSGNRYIARFEPDGFVASEGGGYTTYNVLGSMPQELADHSEDFKMVVLANWGGTYPDEEADFTPGETTIDDICGAEWAQYSHLTDFDLSPGNLIPFYGVHEYKDIKFSSHGSTTLPEPVTLLRAMAKVEVVLQLDNGNEEEVPFEDVTVHRYNDRGYCAPESVYSQYDYDSGYTDWGSDFAEGIHLVNGINDGNGAPEEKELQFAGPQATPASGKTAYTWVAYLPEYSNTTSPDDYAYVEVKLRGLPYRIYFANYTGGTTDAYDGSQSAPDFPDRYDIHRNNLYRFIVTLGDQELNVQVKVWDNEYENEFEFGNSNDN
ncbi:MAG: FimB/Mfa2 family fimbrial subunit [Prevotellaceae bacterium]|nr:FimB/Mfa2 family fimbrial subunit [Prevotellaceae bacterium]